MAGTQVVATAFTRALRIKYPIVQAPCAGHTTADLVAAVSNAGALGSLGAAMMPIDVMRTAIRTIKQKTTHPFAVNLFCRAKQDPTEQELQQVYPGADEVLSAIRSEFQLPTPAKYTLRSPPLEDQISVILEEKVPVVSFTFGVLPDNELQRLWSAGVYLIGTATSVKEAMVLAGLDEADPTRKADAIVAQGLEAGGHRGTFLFGEKQTSTAELVKAIKGALHREGSDTSVDVPVLAAGGLGNGKDVATAIKDWHADGVVLGTMFMLCAESSTSAIQRKVMVESDAETRLTRGLSGRLARGYPNAFMDRMDALADHDIPSYDIHSAHTMDIVGHAAKNGNAEYMMLWSGANAREAAAFTDRGKLPAADIVAKLVAELQ